MAKALIGHLNSDLRVPAHLAAENRHLRQRVIDLEALVLQLKDENDRLTSQSMALLETGAISEMQPV